MRGRVLPGLAAAAATLALPGAAEAQLRFLDCGDYSGARPEAAWLDECPDRAVSRFMRGERVQDRCGRGEPPFAVSAPDPRSLPELGAVRGVPGRRGRFLNAVGASLGDLVDSVYARLFYDPLGIGSEDEIRVAGGDLRGGSYVLGEDLVSVTSVVFDALVEEDGAGSLEPSGTGVPATALRWPECAAQLSPSRSWQRGWSSLLPQARRCASNAAAASAINARG